MSERIIYNSNFLIKFNNLMKKELGEMTKKTHPSYSGWVFWVDNQTNPIFTYVPELNVVDINSELLFKYQSTFDLSLSDFKKLMRKWLPDNLELPNDIKIDFTG